VVLIGAFLVIQLVPYGRNHQNPAVAQEPTWDSDQTRALAEVACFDCHSNETVWPWYSNIAPLSWLIQHDVEEGRQVLNFSEWGRGGEGEELEELGEVIAEGIMPPGSYLPLHPSARLTATERDTLMKGLLATASGRIGESLSPISSLLPEAQN
jgi:mono/diheme cytochrome c family protein